jgi:hypothetical protein
MAARDGTLKAREFLFFCEDQAMAALPAEFPRPERRVMWTILQLHYGNPAIHFELQPQLSRSSVELGLHFESSVEVNDAWAAAVADRADELFPELGPEWELEAWTASWRRLHRTYRFERLTAELGRQVAGDLASVLQLLGPMVSGSPLAAASAAPARPERHGRQPRARRHARR